MADRNGYNKSLFDCEDGVCWLCGAVTDTVRHEIYRGKNRSNSKKYGLWLAVCPRCHSRLHRHDYEEEMHRIGMCKFIADGVGTTDDFVAIFGKEY